VSGICVTSFKVKLFIDKLNRFERINPVPQWATEARSKLSGKKRRRDEMELDGPGANSEDEDRMEKLLQSTAGILSQRKSKVLDKGNIDIARLRDANQSARTEGDVEAIQFHPSPTVSVLLTAGADRRLRLFNVIFG
jgi:U3 small nucleolar RNA-associated protein 18